MSCLGIQAFYFDKNLSAKQAFLIKRLLFCLNNLVSGFFRWRYVLHYEIYVLYYEIIRKEVKKLWQKKVMQILL